MDKKEREALIEEYGQGYSKLAQTLMEIPKEAWQFKPAPTEWSVHEVLVHLADSETNSYGRVRMAAAQPGGTLMAYDQDVWANTLNYHEQSWEDALELLKWVRKTTYDFIKMLPDEVWSNSVNHPEFDKPYTMERWLKIYAKHIPGHIEQIQNNYKMWKERQGKG